MENQNGSSNSYLDNLRNEMLEYQKKEKKSGGNSNRKSKEEILAKYFVPRADREIFRILPPQKNASKVIVEAFFHVVALNASNGKKLKGKVIYCPAHNDAFVPKKDDSGADFKDQNGQSVMIPSECPLCEKNKALLKTQKRDDRLKGKKRDDLSPDLQVLFDRNKEIFKSANEWAAKKFYIVRGIDQGKQKDGVKFWRFKKNFRNQGTFDKLIPVLHQFMEEHKAAYFDIEQGSDISITMTDAEFNGRTYKDISAIICKSPSKLHVDALMVQQWMADPITWRDVFKPKAAPNVTAFEFLEMVSTGTDPFWDDSDQNNKRWVYPGRPDLEDLANQRFRDNDADNSSKYENFQQASDITTGINIDNVTKGHVGDFEKAGVPNAVDVTQGIETELKSTTTNAVEQPPAPVEENVASPITNSSTENKEDEEYDDLPF